MNVVTALNSRYIPYTVTMLTSLVINEQEHIDAYIMHGELTNDEVELMADSLDQFDVDIIPIFVNRELLSEKLPITNTWSIEIYYRLLMLDLLPMSVDRVLYLDGDIIVNKAIDDFYHMDFEGKEIISCIDRMGLAKEENYGEKQREMFAKAFASGYKYFNSGVMLLNISEMRKKYSFQSYLDAFEEWNYQMVAPDQDILNWVHMKHVGYVDYKMYDLFAKFAFVMGWNYKKVKENVAIIHYAGDKPWNNEGKHNEIEKLWWDYAAKTPFHCELLQCFVDKVLFTNEIDNLEMDELKKLVKEQGEVIEKFKQIFDEKQLW